MLANMMMTLAAWLTPKARNGWQLAMQGEYAALRHGRTGWALGCLATAVGWRLRADGLWLLTVISLPLFYMGLILAGWMVEEMARRAGMLLPWTNAQGLGFYIKAMTPFFGLGVLMGYLYPDRTWRTSILMFGVFLAFLYLASAMPEPAYMNLLDLPPVVGETVFWAIMLAGLQAGVLWRKVGAGRRLIEGG